jgi:hypothetical protein
VVSKLTRVNRTRTYRVDGTLPVVRHDTSNVGTGFIGPLTYSQLGYDVYGQPSSTAAHPRLCSSLAICSLQSAMGLWTVNGIKESSRSTPRPSPSALYTVADMIGCGSMGYLSSVDPTKCIVDVLVAPLFYVYCTPTNTKTPCSLYPGGVYAAGKSASDLATVATNLNALFTTMQLNPMAWSDYLDAVGVATTHYNSMQTLRTNTNVLYSSNQPPKGLYYVMSYAAYEVPSPGGSVARGSSTSPWGPIHPRVPRGIQPSPPPPSPRASCTTHPRPR